MSAARNWVDLLQIGLVHCCEQAFSLLAASDDQTRRHRGDRHSSKQSGPWVGLTHGLGRDFSVFGGLGWIESHSMDARTTTLRSTAADPSLHLSSSQQRVHRVSCGDGRATRRSVELRQDSAMSGFPLVLLYSSRVVWQ